MKKYNIWNKIFHKRELNKNVAVQQGLVNSYECYANTLSECYIKEFGVKVFVMLTLVQGMFRTKDINLMTINEVYIGGS